MFRKSYLSFLLLFCSALFVFACSLENSADAIGRGGRRSSSGQTCTNGQCANGQCAAPVAVASQPVRVKAAPIALGDIVIYTVPDGKYAGEKRAATVVFLSDNGRANLSVLKAHLRPGETADTEAPVFFVEDVRYCPEGTKGTFNLKSQTVSAAPVSAQNCPCVEQNGSCNCAQGYGNVQSSGECGNAGFVRRVGGAPIRLLGRIFGRR